MNDDTTPPGEDRRKAAMLKRGQMESEIRASDATARQKSNMLHTLSKLWQFASDVIDESRAAPAAQQAPAPAAEQPLVLVPDLDENDRLRRSLAEDASEMDGLRIQATDARREAEAARRSAAEATEVVRDAHGESARLRGFAAGWLYIVEDSLTKDTAGQAFGLRLLRDQMRRALSGQQALIREARNQREVTMDQTNEIVTPNPAHCPTCGGPDGRARSACLPCGGTGSARACAEYYTEATLRSALAPPVAEQGGEVARLTAEVAIATARARVAGAWAREVEGVADKAEQERDADRKRAERAERDLAAVRDELATVQRLYREEKAHADRIASEAHRERMSALAERNEARECEEIERARAKAAEARLAALEAATQGSPHGPDCRVWTVLNNPGGPMPPCDCWRSRVAATQGPLDREVLDSEEMHEAIWQALRSARGEMWALRTGVPRVMEAIRAVLSKGEAQPPRTGTAPEGEGLTLDRDP